MIEFLYNVVLWTQVALLIVAVAALYVSIEVLNYKEAAKHGTDLPEGLPTQG